MNNSTNSTDQTTDSTSTGIDTNTALLIASIGLQTLHTIWTFIVNKWGNTNLIKDLEILAGSAAITNISKV